MVHEAGWGGHLQTLPGQIMKTLETALGLRRVWGSGGSEGGRHLYASPDTMLVFEVYGQGRKAEASMLSSNLKTLKFASDLFRAVLKHDDPQKGLVFTIAKSAMGGYRISRLGVAGSPIERGNYAPDVLAAYDHIVEDLNTESPCGRLAIFAGEPGTGKCVVKGTQVMDAVSGLLRPIEDIVRNKGRVPSFDRDQGIVFTTPSAWVHTGIKDCLQVTTKAGHSLGATPEHPLLTPDDWKRLDEIQPGMFIATAASVPFPEEKAHIPDAHVVLLAALLAEGGYTADHVSFTNEDPAIIEAVNKALECMGGHLHQYTYMKPFEWRVSSPKTEENGRLSKIRAFLNRYGIGHEKSPDKSIPDIVFRLGPDQLATFLGMLWSCDGSIEKKQGDITLGMASRIIVEQVQHLLLRFGIRSTVKSRTIRRKGQQFHSWRLRVIATSREQFAKTIPMTGIKADRVAKLKFYENPNDDLVPLTEKLRATIGALYDRHLDGGGSFVEMGRILGWDIKTISKNTVLRREHVSRRMLGAFIEVTGAQELAWLIRVRWEKVVSVEAIGPQEVYDLTVPETHNFLAQDIVAHNTYLVRSLLACNPRAAFVLVPPHLVPEMASPEILPTLTAAKEEMDGPIALVIEDADACLVPRDKSGNVRDSNMNAISSLLNLGDGILGSVLDIRIIATTNAHEIQFDDAILRPGRLCKHAHVGPLPAQNAAQVLFRLTGQKLAFKKEATLAQVYAKARELGWKPPPVQKEAAVDGKMVDLRPEILFTEPDVTEG